MGRPEMNSLPHNGGQIIRDLRMKKGLSLKEAAEAADVNYVFLSRLERGLEKPSEDLIKRLASVVGYTGDVNTLTARFGKVPEQIHKLLIDDPDSVVELPAFFKSRRRKRGGI
jgi:transcriptional regulator with XRE-family HTH domain